jgi:pyruvate dehydrogenase E2 component (dihydrolipoamide acetyltransferase)
MVRPITMPKLGQSEEVGTLVQWRKKVGDAIARGDILFDIETDKAVLEVESFFEGTLLKIVVPEGTTVPINATVGFIGNPGEAVPEVPAPAPEPQKPEAPGIPQKTPQLRAPSPAGQTPEPPAAIGDLRPAG